MEKWSDTILEVAARGQIETAWTQMTDALHQMARTQFLRTTSSVPAEIKDATVRRREDLRHGQFAGKRWLRRTIQTHCWPWHGQPGFAVHKLKLATKNDRRLVLDHLQQLLRINFYIASQKSLHKENHAAPCRPGRSREKSGL